LPRLEFPAHRGPARRPGVRVCQMGRFAGPRRTASWAMSRDLGHLFVAASGIPRAPGPGAPTRCSRRPGMPRFPPAPMPRRATFVLPFRRTRPHWSHFGGTQGSDCGQYGVQGSSIRIRQQTQDVQNSVHFAPARAFPPSSLLLSLPLLRSCRGISLSTNYALCPSLPPFRPPPPPALLLSPGWAALREAEDAECNSALPGGLRLIRTAGLVPAFPTRSEIINHKSPMPSPSVISR